MCESGVVSKVDGGGGGVDVLAGGGAGSGKWLQEAVAVPAGCATGWLSSSPSSRPRRRRGARGAHKLHKLHKLFGDTIACIYCLGITLGKARDQC